MLSNIVDYMRSIFIEIAKLVKIRIQLYVIAIANRNKITYIIIVLKNTLYLYFIFNLTS